MQLSYHPFSQADLVCYDADYCRISNRPRVGRSLMKCVNELMFIVHFKPGKRRRTFNRNDVTIFTMLSTC